MHETQVSEIAIRRLFPKLKDAQTYLRVFGLPALIRMDDGTFKPSDEWLKEAVEIMSPANALEA